MADRAHEIDVIDKKYSQTKGLPLEMWEHIFWDASHIDDTEEFTTRAGAHNRLEWDRMEGIPGAARLSSEELAEALRTRRRITLVCKAWYAMGIHVLYSHLRVTWRLWEYKPLYQLTEGCPHLIAHTRRLTVELRGQGAAKPIITNHFYKLALLCSNLPRLQILQAPGELLAIFSIPTLPALPSPLEVFIGLENHRINHYMYQFDSTKFILRQFPDAWTNIRVMSIRVVQLQLCLLDSARSLTFPLLECLRVHENVRGGDNEDAIIYLATKWRAPRIRSLTIFEVTWSPWFEFLRRHSDTLSTLCTFDVDGWHGSPRHDPDEEYRLELPNLRAFYHDWYLEPPASLVANGVQRVGIHEMGLSNLGETFESNLERLCRTFGDWSHYPNIKSCCITGCKMVTKWLEKEPQVIQFVDEMEDKGIEVEFIHLGIEDYGW